ncbi:MAG: S-layer homology domain-containing protein, partial [Clostridiales bacterium]|nr:S-layer homology domain-containing protein [Clostridiales bacterium]
MKFSKNFSKKLFNIISFLMVFVLLFSLPAPTYASAKTDGYIFSDPVTFRYFGRPEATKLIANLSFGDLPADPFERDAIVRSGVLNMIKAYERNYNPGETVTKEGAIAFALRAVGMEDAAQATGVAQLATLPADSPLRSVWSIGYLTLAQTMGLITAADYASAIAQTPVAPAEGQALFVRSDPATREEMADWLVKALEFAQPAIFATTATQQAIYNYNDWESIAPERVNSVEKLLRENIMPGSGGLFDPKGGVTKLETAKILRNMDNIHYNLVGLEKVTGTVAGIQDGNAFTTAAGQGVREIYVRDRDGLVTVLQYTVNVTSSPQDG